jgi:hypothetical protein
MREFLRGRVSPICITLVMLSTAFVAGCTNKQRVIENIDNAIAIVENTSWIDSAEWTIEKVRLGVIPWELAWEQLRPVMPPQFVQNVQRVLDAGGTLHDAMTPILVSAREDQARMLAELQALRVRVEESPDPVDTTLAVIESGGLLVATLAAGTTGVAIFTAVQAIVAVFRRGEKKGAEKVATNIAAGRAVSPEFNAMFVSDNPAARAMKANLQSMPDPVIEGIKQANNSVLAVVAKGNGQKP